MNMPNPYSSGSRDGLMYMTDILLLYGNTCQGISQPGSLSVSSGYMSITQDRQLHLQWSVSLL
jgi:hypothetical protein